MAAVVKVQHVPIQVERSLKLEARSAEEDWSGLASAAERRKIQNRINARAYRKRKSALQKARRTTTPPDMKDSDSIVIAENIANIVQYSPCLREKQSCSHPSLDLRVSLDQFHINYVERLMHPKPTTPSPTSDLLLRLVYYNVYRGFIRNIDILGFDPQYLCAEDSISMFCTGMSGSNLPYDLRPTELQRKRPHHPMCDTFPDPKLRDAFILGIDLLDDDEICYDLLGDACSEPGDELGVDSLRGLIVWGEPYLLQSWEVSQEFYQKWYFLLKDCHEFIAYSNRWRAARGEEPLKIQEIA